MTLLEIINQTITTKQGINTLNSLDKASLLATQSVLVELINETLIDEWITTQILRCSRKGKHQLEGLLEVLDISEINKVFLLDKYEKQRKKFKEKPYIEVNPNIDWKTKIITIQADDGVTLKAKIEYWAKDYSVCMIEPYEVQGCSGHLLYAIPDIYVMNEPTREKNHHIDLNEVVKQNLLNIYARQS